MGWYSDTQGSGPLEGWRLLHILGVNVASAAPREFTTYGSQPSAIPPSRCRSIRRRRCPSPGGTATLNFTLAVPTRVAMDAIADLGGAGQIYWRMDRPAIAGFRTGIDEFDVNSSPNSAAPFIDLPVGTFTVTF